MPSAAALLEPADDARRDVDYRLEHFILDPVAKGVTFRRHKPGLDISGTVVDSSLLLTIEGASTVTLTILDPKLSLLRGDLLTKWTWGTNAEDLDEARWVKDGRAIDAKLDDIWLRLVKVEKQSGGRLVLTFEDRIVAQMRAHSGARKVYRDTNMTRAMFVYALARGAGLRRDQIHIPELHAKQRILRPPQRYTDAERRTEGRKGLDGSAQLTVKGKLAKPEQLRNMETTSDVADRLNAPGLAILAMHCAAIGESEYLKSAAEQVYGTHKGVFQSNQIPADNLEGQAWHFLKGGKSFLAGGAIGLARKQPHLSPGEIAQRVEISDGQASYYNGFVGEARKIMRAYKGGGALTTEQTLTIEKPYAFARGARENSWDAAQRLGSEVNWRAFARKGVFWYASEEYLFAQKPQLSIREGRGPVDEITFDLDLGARDLVTELQAVAHARRWTALPGMLSTVHDQGPADGRWLVHQIEGSLTSDTVTITHNKPLPKKAEPAADTEELTLTNGKIEDGTLRDRIVAVARASMTVHTGFRRYSQAGKLTADPTPLAPARTDCSQWLYAVYKRAGAPDPGTNTYQMAAKGHRTSSPRPGDIMLAPNHCEIYIGNGRTIGHGSPPIDYGRPDNFAGHYFVRIPGVD